MLPLNKRLESIQLNKSDNAPFKQCPKKKNDGPLHKCYNKNYCMHQGASEPIVAILTIYRV